MSSTSNFVQSEFRYDEGKSPLILLAETCRNIGLDTTSSKSAKSSIDHVKSSNNSSSLSSSSSSSIESSSSRKNNDSCRLSVSPLRNSTPINSTNRTSANSVNGSNNITITNHSSSSSSSSTDSFIGNNNNNNNNNNVTTSISNSESNGCSFKPYEDHIISKKKCPDDSRTRSTPQNAQHSDNKSRHHHNNNKHYVNKSENISKSYESNSLNKRENVKSSSSLSTNVSNIGSSSSSSTTTPSTSSLVSTSSSNTTSTSTVHVNHSSPSSKGSNCNDCLSPHRPSSKPYPLTVDSVSKYVPYPSLSPYLGLPPPNGYDPASVAAVAAAVAGHCHSPSMCRDPFCAGCRFNAAAVANALHHHQVSPCPAGCTQCSHVTSQMTSSISHQIAALQANGYLPGNSFYPPPPHPHHSHPANPPTSSSSSSSSSSTNSPQAAAAAAAAAVAAAASASNVNGKPNVCSWMMGNTYCGKRFTSSEELQQHLRNHTSSVSALAFLGQYPHLDPMLTSPIAGLRRTTFVPVNRHHPYKSLTTSGSPLNTLTNGLTGAIHKPPPGSQLNMHYPPYGPYTGRLGPPILP